MSIQEVKPVSFEDPSIVALLNAVDTFFRALVQKVGYINEVNSLSDHTVSFRLYSESDSRWNYEGTEQIAIFKYFAYWSVPLVNLPEYIREDYLSYYNGSLQGTMAMILSFTQVRDKKTFDPGKRADLVVANFNDKFEDRRNQETIMSRTHHFTPDDFGVNSQKLDPHFVARVSAYVIRAQQQGHRIKELTHDH